MKVLTLNTTTTSNSVSVSGTTEEGMLAIAISIFDKAGENRLVLRTAPVIDGEYSYTVDGLELGEYQICVADYDMGECLTETITIAEEVTPTPEESEDSTAGTPETGYQTIAKTEAPAPEANGSSSSPALYISLAAGIVSAAIVVFALRRIMSAKRAK